jgi:hypothetical protein
VYIPALASSSAVGGVQGGLATTEAVFIAPVIPKQAILSNVLTLALLVLKMTLVYHTVAAYITMGLKTTVCIQCITSVKCHLYSIQLATLIVEHFKKVFLF